MRRATSNVRVEVSVTFAAQKTAAQIDTAVAALQTALEALPGITIANCVVSEYAPPGAPPWSEIE